MTNKTKQAIDYLPEDWKDIMLSEYKQGASDTEIRAELGITYKVWQVLVLESAEFQQIVTLGKQFSKAWWLKQGRRQLENRSFNAYLWYKNMQNRFAWSEKQQTNVDAPSADEEEMIDEDSIDDKLQQLLKEAGVPVLN